MCIVLLQLSHILHSISFPKGKSDFSQTYTSLMTLASLYFAGIQNHVITKQHAINTEHLVEYSEYFDPHQSI